MADISLVLDRPKIKSSAGNTINDDTSSISGYTVCSQCGHDHSCKIIGGKAIHDMISFLDRGTVKNERP